MANDPNIITQEDITKTKSHISTIDQVVESNEDTTTTFSGKTINTLIGRLRQIGYLPPVLYASGITFTSTDIAKTIERDGVVYGPIVDNLPFTTSGTWGGDDENNFQVVQQLNDEAENINVNNSNNTLGGVNVQEDIDELDGKAEQNIANIAQNANDIQSNTTAIQSNTTAINNINSGWNSPIMQIEGSSPLVFNNMTWCTASQLAIMGLNSDDLAMYLFDGTDFSLIGNSLDLGNPLVTDICRLDDNSVAYVDTGSGNLERYDFDGNDWAQIGSSLNVVTDTTRITKIDANTIGFHTTSPNTLTTYQNDGFTWSQIGNTLNLSTFGGRITTLSQNRVAIMDSNQVRVYDFDGADWAQIGNSLIIQNWFNSNIESINETDVVVFSGSLRQVNIYRFDGLDFTEVGDLSNLEDGPLTTMNMTAQNGTRVLFHDTAVSNNLRLFEFSFSINGSPFYRT